MAASQTCAQKTLFRIGTVRGNLAFLRQPDPGMISTILNRYALQYRITPNAMTKNRVLANSSPEDCAGMLVNSLDKITADAGFIRGINHVDAEVVNSHLHVLALECKSFSLVQDLSEASQVRITAALERFNAKGFDGAFAGSARTPVASYMSTQRV